MDNIISTYSINMAVPIQTQRLAIKSLLEKDIAEGGRKKYHPKNINITNPSKKLLDYNKRLIREGKTSFYLDQSKIYNADTGRFINKPVDRRYTDGRVKKSFENKFNVFNSTFATKKPIRDFRFVVDDIAAPGWTRTGGDLYDNTLLIDLIKNNDLKGKQRIIIQKNGVEIWDRNYDIRGSVNKWWNEVKGDFYAEESPFLKWNYDLSNGDVVNIIFSKETKLQGQYFQQTFRDGKLSRCLLQPIYDWAQDKLESSKSKAAKSRYLKIINRFKNRMLKHREVSGYFDKYANGVPEDQLSTICEDCEIGMEITQPFNENTMFEYQPTKRGTGKTFRWINSRYNHVDLATKPLLYNTIFKVGDCDEIESRDEMRKILKDYHDKSIYPVYNRDPHGITSIQTLDKHYKLYNEYSSVVREWEREQGLDSCSIDAKDLPDMQSFINAGTHFNGTIDFKDTSYFTDVFNDCVIMPPWLRHIDMTKAFARFKDYEYYDGFMTKITDYRYTDKYYDNGLYLIDSLDFEGCSEQFRQLNDMLGWYINYNVYPVADLKALERYGGKFKVLCGVWGIKEDWEYNDDMINKKVKINIGEEVGEVAYYCKSAGMNASLNYTKSFYMKGEKEYFQNIVHNTNADIYITDTHDARITFDSKYVYNKKHITAQITSYQRLQMLEQLMKMDLEKVIRICVDGIYFVKHNFVKDDIFNYKSKITFVNDPCESYLSGIINKIELDNNFTGMEPFMEYHRVSLYNGAGGDGKTYGLLMKDHGHVNVVYAPHSNKLASTMKQKYFEKFGKKLNVSNHTRLLEAPFALGEDGKIGECHKYNVYFIDECSMLTEEDKMFMIENIRGKIFFIGDLDCQLLPSKVGGRFSTKGIDYIAPQSKVNYRFKDEEQKQACKYVRDCIKNPMPMQLHKLPYKCVDHDYVKKNYKVQDIILVSRGATGNKSNTNYNNYWNEIFKDIPKYKVKNNTRDYSNGDIVFKKIKNVITEFRHGYTIHSVQGETYEHNIYIDMRHMVDVRMFYTAISRAQYHTQIYLVYDK